MAGRKVEFSTRREVKLPNASTLGYGRWKARAGDFIVYKEQHSVSVPAEEHSRLARVIGQITSVEGRTDDPCVGFLVVLAVDDEAAYGYERWINADDVTECRSPEHARAFLTWLVQATPSELFKYCRDDLEERQKASCHHFIPKKNAASTCSSCGGTRAHELHVVERER